MKKIQLLEKYPVYTLELKKSEIKQKNAKEVFDFFKSKIDAHPVASYIAEFDHMKHTKSLADGKVCDGMIDARNIIFCFGKEIPNGKILAVRPRSIGICEFSDHIELSFLEVPNENLQKVVEGWISELVGN